MFDANMRYLPKGKKFFAEVFSAGKRLKKLGVNKGELLLCHMLNESGEDPCVDILVNGKLITISSGTGEMDFSDNLVYTGNHDGTGFIDAKLRAVAMAQLST